MISSIGALHMERSSSGTRETARVGGITCFQTGKGQSLASTFEIAQ